MIEVKTSKNNNTVNVDIFAFYIFLRYSRFLNIREYMYNLKITCIREDIKIYNCWLQPACCSTQQMCMAFPR